jgi:hypothetical protein
MRPTAAFPKLVEQHKKLARHAMMHAFFALPILCCVSIAHAQNGLIGSGTANTVVVWTGFSSLGNSPITVNGGSVGIGTSTPDAELQVINTTTGLDGISGSGEENGIDALSTTTTGEGNGLFAQAENPVAVGVRGQDTATTGGTGIWGISNGLSGNGGVFTNTAGDVVIKGEVGPFRRQSPFLGSMAPAKVSSTAEHKLEALILPNQLRWRRSFPRMNPVIC